MKDDETPDTDSEPPGEGTATWNPGDPSGTIRREPAGPGLGTLLGDRFLLQRVLGKGGSGVVLAATDTRVGQDVAVKVLDPGLASANARERLQREVRLSRPGHPNLVTVFDVHFADNTSFLSMEIVEGTSLRHLVKHKGRLGVPETVAMAVHVASALEYLHGRGLVHRDVKPGNILLGSDGRTKLCDMGLVRPLESGMTVTETAMVVGTPAYMAPEQGAGTALTPACDIYALGLCLFHSLTGEVPLTEDTAVATLMRRQHSRCPSVTSLAPECPRWLDRLVRQMVTARPGDRPDAAAVIRALQSGRVRRRLRRRHVAAALLVAVLVVGGTVAARYLATEPTVAIEAEGRELRGRDGSGRITWAVDLEQPVVELAEADLDGDGVPEAIVSAFARSRVVAADDPASHSEFLVVARTGEIVTRVHPAELVPWMWEYSEAMRAYPNLLDLDGDGLPEVVLNCRHPVYFPSAVLVYWPGAGRWDCVLRHSGWIYQLAALPDPAAPRLRFVAINNQLAAYPVAGEFALDIEDLAARSAADRRSLGSPDFSATDRTGLAWQWYTPLAQLPIKARPPVHRLEVLLDGGSEITFWGSELVLDRFGNPVPGPNSGIDLRSERRAFFGDVALLKSARQPLESAAIRDVARDVVERAGRLMDEEPYRVLVALAAARSQARVGDLPSAIGILREAVALSESEELSYRLAHLEAISGQLDAASNRLTRALEDPQTARGYYDLPKLLLAVCIAGSDREGFRRAVDLFPLGTAEEEAACSRAALWAWARLWWDEVQSGDCGIEPASYLAEAPALACLARWRLGRAGTADLADIEGRATQGNEAVTENQLALAAARLASGEIEEAVDGLDQLVDRLEPQATDDFLLLQHLRMARGLRVVALVASGQDDRALREAGALADTVDGQLLPAHLAREVLSARLEP